MTTNSNPKDSSQKGEEQPKKSQDNPQEEAQTDQLTLDTDLEFEDLVESISKKEDEMKKNENED